MSTQAVGRNVSTAARGEVRTICATAAAVAAVCWREAPAGKKTIAPDAENAMRMWFSVRTAGDV